MKDSVSDRMVREIISRCNVYPKQNHMDIKEHIEKVALLANEELETSLQKRKIIRETSKAMDLKSRIENDDWIKFEQDTIDLENFR